MQEALTIFNILVISGLTLLLLFTAKRTKSSLSLLLILIGLLLWTITNYLSLNTPSENDTLFWMRSVMSVTNILSLGVFLLGQYFPNNEPYFPRWVCFTMVLTHLFNMTILSLSDGVIAGILYRDNSIIPIFGNFILMYIIIILLSVFLFGFATYKKNKNLYGNYKKQLRILSTGVLISSVLGLITNFIMLIAFNNSDFIVLGPIFGLIIAAFTMIAILKHRLFDTRLILGRILYYTVLQTYTVIFVLIIIFLTENLFQERNITNVLIITIPIGFVYLTLLDKLIELLQTKVTSRLINPNYDPLFSQDRLNKELSITVDLAKVTNIVKNLLITTIRPEFFEMIILNSTISDSGKYNQISDKLMSLWEDIGIVMINYYHITDSNDLPSEFRDNAKQVDEIRQFMEKENIKIFCPFGIKKTLGFFTIGQKEIDIPYELQDMKFINTVSSITAAAVERALLYEEVQEFNKTLQSKVDKATEELQKSLTQVQELRRQERDMVDVMGHELRTPIAIVRNALVMLEMQIKSNKIDTEKLKKYVDMALESARREIRLIETLLSATKIEGNRIQLDFTKVDLKDVINDAIEGSKHIAEEKDIKIIYKDPENDLFAYADRVRTQEVMDNFLSNSAKYTQEGTITIKTSIDEEKNMAYVSVIDTGMGIDEEDLKKLGKKFFRAKQYVHDDNGKHTKVVRPGGTGLGLYVVFELIELMGGERIITSKVGQGSNFTFGLPLYKGQENKHLDQTFLTGSASDNTEDEAN